MTLIPPKLRFLTGAARNRFPDRAQTILGGQLRMLLSCITMTLAFLTSCVPTQPNTLDKLGTVPVTIKDLSVQAWIADTDDERQKGLMFVTAAEMGPVREGLERGMLFIFPRDQRTGFWMRNTIINLDIAFIRADGTIVHTFTMAALDESSYTPSGGYRYALEVKAGLFRAHGIVAGDRVTLPDSLLKTAK